MKKLFKASTKLFTPAKSQQQQQSSDGGEAPRSRRFSATSNNSSSQNREGLPPPSPSPQPPPTPKDLPRAAPPPPKDLPRAAPPPPKTNSKVTSAAPTATTDDGEVEDSVLRTMLEKKLSFPRGEILLVIRLLPNHSDELLYLICRRPTADKVLMEGVSPKLQSTFSYSLKDLLTLTEEEGSSVNLITLQFAGSRSVSVCMDDEEKNWLFYCTTRLCREFCGNEKVTIVTNSNLRLRTSETVLKLKCPILLGSKMTSDVRVATPPKSFLNNSMFPSPNTSFHKPLFAVSPSPLLNSNHQSEEQESKHELLDDIFPASQFAPNLQDWFAQAELNNVVHAERDTMQDLSVWESCAANDVVVTGQNSSFSNHSHGRDGDPIASMLQHLENVELRLEQAETCMTEAQEASALAMASAQELTKELLAINSDTQFKTNLAKHLDQVLSTA